MSASAGITNKDFFLGFLHSFSFATSNTFIFAVVQDFT